MPDETVITFRAHNCGFDPDDAADEDNKEDIAKFFASPFPEQMDITVHIRHMIGERYDKSGLYTKSTVYFEFRGIDGKNPVIKPLKLDYEERDFERKEGAGYLISTDTYSLAVFDDGPPHAANGHVSFFGRFNDEFYAELDSEKARILIYMDSAVFGCCPDVDGVGIWCEISRKEFHELARRIRESIPEDNRALSMKNQDEYLARCGKYPVYCGGFIADKDQTE